MVADADVLAADLLCGGTARAALDHLRRHSWTTLVASDALLDDAETVIAATIGRGSDGGEPEEDDALAADWRERVEAWREPVDHPEGDHPALASAYRGRAMHVVSFDESLTSASVATDLVARFPVSVREPAAFDTLFDPESLYAEVVGGEYPGPDRDSLSTS